jgi:hypothetical protein
MACQQEKIQNSLVQPSNRIHISENSFVNIFSDHHLKLFSTFLLDIEEDLMVQEHSLATSHFHIIVPCMSDSQQFWIGDWIY